MNLQGAGAWHFIILTTFLTLLSACGGGSTDEAPLEIPKVTYHALPTSMSVNEGETVRLTLNLAGEGVDQLKFNWQVSQDIPFTGQGTDTINFTAPNVDQLSTINVQVTLENSSKVIGFSDQRTSVIVANIETLNENNGNMPQSGLPKVDNLNFDGLTSGSTWFNEQVSFTSTINSNGNTITGETRRLNLTYIEAINVSTETITLSECGLTDTYDININEFAADVQCETSSSLNIIQNDNEFRLERMCGDKVVMASTYTKKSDNRSVSHGELNINFSSYENLANTTQVCGIVVTSEVKSYASNDILSETAKASILRLFTEYQGNPFELQFLLDKHPTNLFAFLTTGFMTDNFAKIYSNVLPEISNLPESDSGTINFDFYNDNKNIKADFDFSLSSADGHRESIEGSLTLLFE